MNYSVTKVKKFAAMFMFLTFSLFVNAQFKNLGLPYILNYNAEQYLAQKQNWVCVEDFRNVMYFGNTSGVLEFDGQNWTLINVTNNSLPVRSLAINKKGRIFVGSNKEFGYLTPDSSGNLQYYSLAKKLTNEKDKKFVTIFKIFFLGDKVYFAGDDILFEYFNGQIKANHIKKLKQAFEFDGRIFLRIEDIGLCEYKNGKTELLPDGQKFSKFTLRALLPHDGNILCVTSTDGLYVLDTKHIEKFSTPIDKYLKTQNIVSAIQLKDGKYALGLFTEGLIILSAKGELINHLDISTGLQSGQINNILEDSNNNLWLSTDNGISYILSSLPLSVYDKNYNLNSASYTALVKDDNLYLGSAYGLFYRNWQLKENHLSTPDLFKPLGENQSVLYLDTINGVLLGANNKGISVIDGNKISNIDIKTVDAVWKFLRVEGRNDIIIAGTNKGLILLEYQTKKKIFSKKLKSKPTGTWVYKRKINGFVEKCRYIEIDKQNNIWFADKAIGIFKLVLNMNFDSVATYSYNENKGINTTNNYILKLNDDILLGTDNGLYVYDKGKDFFLKEQNIDPIIGQGVKVTNLITDNQGNIWFKQRRTIKQTNDDEMGELIHQKNGSYILNKAPFSKLKNNIYSINPISKDHILVGTDKGFVHYDPNVQKDFARKYKALIRKVEFIANDSVIFNGAFMDSEGMVSTTQGLSQTYKIPYKFNGIRFTFSSPYYDSPDEVQFKFYLEGNDNTWLDWKSKTFKEYSNLPAGTYIFHVKAKNIYGFESDEATYTIYILPPWYQTLWARIGYFVLGILFIWGIVRLSVRRLRKQKEHLEQLVKERTIEITIKNTELEQQKEEIMAQRDEIETRNNELYTKNGELAEKNIQIEAQRDKLSETNKIIEDKNKNITASITYAKRIQEAMLPLREKIDEALPENFILFKPRDIVSGDFYWFATKNDKVIYTAVDCTGHGVPGAFMSMIGSEILTKIISQGITTPSEILDNKNKYVRSALKQDQTDNQDGMDMSLCTIDKKTKTVEWAGAKNPLIYIKNNEVFHLKGDMQSIGGHQMTKSELKFANYVVSYADAPTYFYTFTDGYQDQFGGDKNRKFMVKRLKEILLEIHQKPMEEQREILKMHIEKWMENAGQTDDILVIGFKLTP